MLYQTFIEMHVVPRSMAISTPDELKPEIIEIDMRERFILPGISVAEYSFGDGNRFPTEDPGEGDPLPVLPVR